ncbi:RtcB family protein [Desulfogranum japonicum]|uniref:RtcB family protein n=1 Tax=Desulfogranum japonicum TaxID=231447 RepID=UPI00040A8E3A|nr:RtcB family protein [Desulfogranum japonicum]
MKQVISTEQKPIKMWLDDMEPSALAQAKNLANLPFTFKHVAIMPDAHCGYGMPIGGVLATQGVVIPNAVGVDIGCGMCAVRTSLTDISSEQLKQVLGSEREKTGIRSRIPLGFKHHKRAREEALMPDLALVEKVKKSKVLEQYQAALKQLGTLGGGNHFIEIQKGDDSHIWLMVHSGSRNLGLKVATMYNKLAVKLNERWHSQIPKKWELAFLPLDTEHAWDYIYEMRYCVEFALASRTLMMEKIKECLTEVMGAVSFDPMINIAHNYASQEHHFGEDVIVHRKGATSARQGEIGIIPGSQGSTSYIVQGKGNPESYCSCSHGAGRLMGRKQAQKLLNLEQEKNRLDQLGVIHGLRSKRDLDEAASAYKDIDTVMANQTDLVDILVSLKPLAVIKG